MERRHRSIALLGALALCAVVAAPATASEPRAPEHTPSAAPPPSPVMRELTPDTALRFYDVHVLTLRADSVLHRVQLTLPDTAPRTRASVHAVALLGSPSAACRATEQLARPPAAGYMLSTDLSHSLVPYVVTRGETDPSTTCHERLRAGRQTPSREPLRRYDAAGNRHPG